ncbi:hypothetical protein D3C86_1947640 [compost metagenome]
MGGADWLARGNRRASLESGLPRIISCAASLFLFNRLFYLAPSGTIPSLRLVWIVTACQAVIRRWCLPVPAGVGAGAC